MAALWVGIGLAALLLLVGFLVLLPLGLISGIFGDDVAMIRGGLRSSHVRGHGRAPDS